MIGMRCPDAAQEALELLGIEDRLSNGEVRSGFDLPGEPLQLMLQVGPLVEGNPDDESGGLARSGCRPDRGPG